MESLLPSTAMPTLSPPPAPTHTSVLHLNANGSFQKAMVMSQLGREVSREKREVSAPFQDLPPPQSVPRHTVHPKLGIRVSSRSKCSCCHLSTPAETL